MRVDHVLLTRFNLPSQGVESLIRAREGWLRERVDLFERYCLPSVEGQLGRRPSWIVYVDPQSPSWLLERMEGWRSAGLLTPVLREAVSREELVSDLRSVVDDPGDVLVTTNLDNDDGLALDFSSRLTGLDVSHERCAVYLTHGLIKSPAGLYRRTDRHNAFCSVREGWGDPVTAWSAYHNELPRTMPAVLLGAAPGWLQIVHGSNVSNRVRGRLVSPRGYRRLFAEGALDEAEPTRADLARDLLVRSPVRAVRDGVRAGLRSGALRLLGKERYARMKARMRLMVTAHGKAEG
ncbi:glycosyltransferase [Nocardioides sp. LHG3406-4]|uniref:glycosyltransferase n=1 Tax=Nocardioides sp. LHG3406-4 TaxID=2804575 RepID=UPI003CE8D071